MLAVTKLAHWHKPPGHSGGILKSYGRTLDALALHCKCHGSASMHSMAVPVCAAFPHDYGSRWMTIALLRSSGIVAIWQDAAIVQQCARSAAIGGLPTAWRSPSVIRGS
jgi:hypothetical protein